MLTPEEFATAVRTFMGEMSVICLRQTPESLRTLSGFEDEMREARSLICDESTSSAMALSAAFGIVDEFFARKGESLINEAFNSYSTEHSKPTGE